MSVRRYSRMRPKRDDIWQRLGVDRANYAPVVLPPQVGPAIDNGLLCVRPFADIRQNGSDLILSGGSLQTAEGPGCHHLVEYTVNGDCLRCDLERHGREDASIKQELTADTQLGDTR